MVRAGVAFTSGQQPFSLSDALYGDEMRLSVRPMNFGIPCNAQDVMPGLLCHLLQ